MTSDAGAIRFVSVAMLIVASGLFFLNYFSGWTKSDAQTKRRAERDVTRFGREQTVLLAPGPNSMGHLIPQPASSQIEPMGAGAMSAGRMGVGA
jgi:hypothetical protein